MRRTAFLAAAALALAACASSDEQAAPVETRAAPQAAPAPAPAETAAIDTRDCFNIRAISGFSHVDDDTLRINVGASRAYEIDTSGATCRNLRFANQISLEADPASNFLCVGGRAMTARVRTDQGDECFVDAVRRVPDADTADAG